ncbi:hypothetical protein [Piscibacillus halophilus]|uniref:hypothetical protein n=1 Tax=Piscibacillus halophilus TaxID=571933 RepID=UPI0024099E62|nr:hypothetical protein [Piscibacillus halophilus]
MKNSRLQKFSLGVVILLGLLFFVWASGWGSLWINGISHAANNTEDFYHHPVPIDGEYTVEIDLSDLDSNEGKMLYRDEDRHIFISKVTMNDSVYEVTFRSFGTYGLNNAMLVSGIEHGQSMNGYKSELQAEAHAEYKGVSYDLDPSGSTGLIHRDGDEFSFYLNPSGEIDLDLNEEPIIEVTVSNLVVNLWVKIPQ